MMRGLDHKHVLALIGVCMDSDVEHCRTSPLIVLPFMKYGDLRTFLRDGNNVSTVTINRPGTHSRLTIVSVVRYLLLVTTIYTHMLFTRVEESNQYLQLNSLAHQVA